MFKSLLNETPVNFIFSRNLQIWMQPDSLVKQQFDFNRIIVKYLVETWIHGRTEMFFRVFSKLSAFLQHSFEF